MAPKKAEEARLKREEKEKQKELKNADRPVSTR